MPPAICAATYNSASRGVRSRRSAKISETAGVEMRPRYGAEDGDQHHQDRAVRQRVAEQRERDIFGEAFGHDAGADHGRDQQRRSKRFRRQPAR
jgi:hypothetical protein